MKATPHLTYFYQKIFNVNDTTSFVMDTAAFFIARLRVVINPIITIRFNNMKPTKVSQESPEDQQ